MSFSTFFLSKAIWKGARRAAQVVAGFAAASLAKYVGIDLDSAQEAALVTGITGALETGLNFAKQRLPNQFGWL